MRKLLQRIFGLFPTTQQMARNLKHDECGFVFLEVLVGLPLILVLLLALNNLFANSWTKCKYMVADFILQQEMESAMDRIVADAKIAYKVEAPDQYGHLRLYQHVMPTFDNVKNREIGKPYYAFINNQIYHNGAGSPITGGNSLSGAYVKDFQYRLINPRLLYLKIEAKSAQSEHTFTLVTKVFLRGLQE